VGQHQFPVAELSNFWRNSLTTYIYNKTSKKLTITQNFPKIFPCKFSVPKIPCLMHIHAIIGKRMMIDENEITEFDLNETIPEAARKRRGRPKKSLTVDAQNSKTSVRGFPKPSKPISTVKKQLREPLHWPTDFKFTTKGLYTVASYKTIIYVEGNSKKEAESLLKEEICRIYEFYSGIRGLSGVSKEKFDIVKELYNV
jgi:hypothetical protein